MPRSDDLANRLTVTIVPSLDPPASRGALQCAPTSIEDWHRLYPNACKNLQGVRFLEAPRVDALVFDYIIINLDQKPILIFPMFQTTLYLGRFLHHPVLGIAVISTQSITPETSTAALQLAVETYQAMAKVLRKPLSLVLQLGEDRPETAQTLTDFLNSYIPLVDHPTTRLKSRFIPTRIWLRSRNPLVNVLLKGLSRFINMDNEAYQAVAPSKPQDLLLVRPLHEKNLGISAGVM